MSICFHCGGNHNSNSCPIRSQEKTTNAIEKMGYKQLSAMNDMVSKADAIEIRSELSHLGEIRSELSHLGEKGSEMSRSLRELVDSQRELVDVLELQHSETMWLMEKQISVLTGISDMIKHSQATLSEEKLQMGINSLKVGMIKEGMKKLKEAVEINPLDYRIYITMGHAYLEMNDLKNALDRFEYAFKNARTNYYKSYSLSLISRIYFCLGDIEKAIENIKLAIKLSPEEPEFHYHYSTYLAQKLIQKLER